MLKRMVLGLLFALLPGVAAAQTQENYLPAKSQLYFRWDGMQKHQAAFDKTAVGKMMQGETGKFLDELWDFTYENLKTAAQNEPKVEPLLKDLVKVIVTMHKQGLVFGLELDKIDPMGNPPVVAQAVLVFPTGAGESGTVLSLIQKIAEETRVPVKNTKVGKRFVHTIGIEDKAFLGWWAQGNDAVVYFGTSDPVEYAKNIDGKKTGLTKNPLYQRVAKFKEFETASRGYFDVASVLKVADEIHPQAPKIIDELGLRGLKNIVFMSGFDGPAERSVVEADIPSPRKGLLSLAGTRKISLKDMPVLPSDMSRFSAGSANLSQSYDVITKLLYGVLNVAAPDELDKVKDAIKNFEGAVGVDISKDLFAQFGDIVLSYNSPSDGFLGTGAVVAIQVKDGKKLTATIEKLLKAIPVGPAGEISMKRKAYRGGEIMQVGLSGPMFNSHIASFGIYKNWFVYAQFPTPIKGFILRQEGVLPGWEPDDATKKALAQFPSEFNSIQISDPRPTIKTALTIAPFVLNLVNTFGPFGVPGYRPFDLELIPHAQEATRHLFPNITVGIDDGKRVRSETRGSLLLPF